MNIVELPRALLPDDLLSLLQRLQELHLQENSIELLEDQALAGLSSLALLDLSRNQLGTISREALQPLSSLQVLRLTGNFLWQGSLLAPVGRSRLRYTGDSYARNREHSTLWPHQPREFSGRTRFLTSLQKRIQNKPRCD